jgi:uncharacterized membrane protein (DUF4010 family)
MTAANAPIWDLGVALVIGLVIGAERERRKAGSGSPMAAGIRTFAATSLCGAVSLMVGGVALLAVAVVAVSLLAALSYLVTREASDPGITTEVALVLTVLLGALATQAPVAAAAAGVTVAILLAARAPIHRLITSVLSERELASGLILAAATVVVLPLLPDRQMGPYGALNPRSIWRLVVLVLAIGGGGHVAVRAFGARLGLPIAGLAGGFISSSATIGAMGARAAKSPAILGAAVAGAVLSTVATVAQLAAVLGATNVPTLTAMTAPLACAGVTALAYGAIFTLRSLRQSAEAAPSEGEAFSLSTAFVFALTLSAILVASAALRDWFGESGAIAAAALAGFVDTHAAAISIASLAATGAMTPADAVIPILAGFSTNTLTKLTLAAAAGGRPFSLRVSPGLVLVAAAAWLGALVAG